MSDAPPPILPTGDLAGFSLGRVVAQGVAAVRANPTAILTAAFLFGAAPTVASGYAYDHLLDSVLTSYGAAGLVALSSSIQVVGVVTTIAMQGAMARAALSAEEGVSVWETVRPALTRLPALIVAGLVIGLATLVAGLFLILPGLILYAGWSVVAPAMIEEGIGIRAGLRRSRALTAVARGRVMALNLLLIIGYSVLSLLLYAGGVALWQGWEVLLADTAPPLPIVFYLALLVPVTLASAIWGAIVVTLYTTLRERVDGEPTGRLAQVFA